MQGTDPKLQKDIQVKGQTIFELMETEGTKSVFNRDWWYGRIMEASMKNERFKTQMFRFVDVLPYLQSGSEVARHLKEYFSEGGEQLPSILNVGVGIGSLAPGLMAGAIRKQITGMAKMFIVGETPTEALPSLKKSRKNKIAFTVDLLGEACLSEAEASDYQKRYLDLIDWLSQDAKSWESIPQIDNDDLGPIPKVNVSVKLSSLYSQIDVKAFAESVQILKDRMRPILRKAISCGAALTFDMEQYELKDLTLAVFCELLSEAEFKTYPQFGCVIQAYLKDSLADLQRLAVFAKARGMRLNVRLVKGAYWDFETVNAAQSGWPVPVYINKKNCDANYEDCAKFLIGEVAWLRPAFASHNVRSISAALVFAEKMGVPLQALELQMLYGMADPIKASLSKMGLRVREYAPVGDLIPGMAYLVRRLLENTSNESFLRSKFADGETPEKLLSDPHLQNGTSSSMGTRKKSSVYQNQPLLDFGVANNRENLLKSFQSYKNQMGKDHPLHINGKDVMTDRMLASVSPSNPSTQVGRVALAGIKEASEAMDAAKSAFAKWSRSSVESRAKILEQLADRILADRFNLICLEVLEAGKQWDEADGDLAEAVDFCRYYAQEMRKLALGHKQGDVPGEISLLTYRPRGVSVVIAPWNFPLAILCGMVAGSLVTGNTCIMKPAEQTPLLGVWLMNALKDLLPPGVLNLLNGYGEEIGAFLVSHPDVAQVCFTGSKTVGLSILQEAAKVKAGQRQLKRVICEMGGKNAIIIDSDADLDEAVQGVLYSAFGYQGQKCSAASRVIVLDEIYARFTERLLEAAKSLKVGDPENPSCFIGPVIDAEAQSRILAMIEVGKSEAKMAFQGAVPANGYYAPPTIFIDVNSKARIAQEEIFGPVLAVIPAKDFSTAIEIALDVEYALTGGVYSRSPANIEKAKQEFIVGNLYINRGITGAMVERHPFGGFKMSGLGSKTGGPDYLVQFLDPMVQTENTLRRGFAPTEEL